MTSFENNDSNPYDRASPWPKMPQGPFRVGGPMGAAVAGAVVARPEPTPEPEPPERVIEPPLAVETPEPEPRAFAIPPEPEPSFAASPIVAPITPRRGPAPARGLRLSPLIAAAAVGAGGMLALVLVVGIGKPPPAVQPAAAPQTLAVGELVGQSPAAPPAATSSVAPAPAAAPPPAAKATAPRLALAVQPRPPVAAPKLTPVSSSSSPPPPMLAIPAPAQPLPTQIQLPAARPIASLAGPAEPPLTAPAPAPVFTPKPAPDPNAPIPTHAPDAN